MTKNNNPTCGLFVFVFVFALSLSFGLSEAALAQGSLEGAWVLEQTEDADGNVDTEPLPGLWLFTDNHYSIMFVTGNKPRALMNDENPSDAQMLEAFRSFIANSGRYEVEGDQVITHPYVAKSPNFMAGWPETTLTFSFVRDGDTLTISTPEGAKSMFQNVDSAPPPWEQ